MERKLTVFCSASYTIDPYYNKIARDFVRKAAEKGYTIVTGGTVKGTMGEVSDELYRGGWKHIGIIPRFMEQVVYPDLSETVWVSTMQERQDLMRAGAEAVVALPGGIGTLYELIETLVLIKLKRYEGRIYVLNINGFYDQLDALLDHYVDSGMLDADVRALVRSFDSVEALCEVL